MPVHLLAATPLEARPLLLSRAGEPFVEVGRSTVNALLVKIEVSQL